MLLETYISLFAFIDIELTVADFHTVYQRLYEARSKWYNIGIWLGVDAESLTCINVQNREDPEKCLGQMLNKHLGSSNSLTWKDLCDCLMSPMVDRPIVAKQIEVWVIEKGKVCPANSVCT